MNYVKILLGLLICSSFIACNKQSRTGSFVPSCILSKIDELKSKPKQNPPAEVYEYSYQNKKAYYFTADCCDQFNLLYDANCKVICAPHGGISAKGDGNCSDFNESGKDAVLIWKDMR